VEHDPNHLPDQLNVLIIDDDPGLRRVLVEIVTGEEHQAVAVESAEAGLELLPHWTFHVAFLDYNLPGMDGLLLGEYLRSNNPDMVVALVTGDPSPRLRRSSEELSIVFIEKPFEMDAILDVLDAYRTGTRERRERRLRREHVHWAPPFASFADDLAAEFSVPNVPGRLEARLVERVKRALNDLRASGRYDERERVVALCGLLAARVLGLRLPNASSGRTLFEEYDALMRRHDRRTEFE